MIHFKETKIESCSVASGLEQNLLHTGISSLLEPEVLLSEIGEKEFIPISNSSIINSVR